jgi:hypothetical protein
MYVHYHNVYVIAIIRRDTRIEQFNTSQLVSHKYSEARFGPVVRQTTKRMNEIQSVRKRLNEIQGVRKRLN